VYIIKRVVFTTVYDESFHPMLLGDSRLDPELFR